MRIEIKIAINSALRILNKQNSCVPVKEEFLIYICLTLSSITGFSGVTPQGCPGGFSSSARFSYPSNAVFGPWPQQPVANVAAEA